MSNTLQCPNPVCTHVFAPEVVKGTAKLACPRCGSVFDFRGKSAGQTPAPLASKPATPRPTPAPAAPPTAKPAAPPPLALPVTAPVIPIAIPVLSARPNATPVAALAPAAETLPEPDLQFDSGVTRAASGARRRGPRSKRRGSTLFLVGLFAGLVLVCGGIVAGAALLVGYPPNFNLGLRPSGESWEWPQGNCAFRSPGDAWQHDKEWQVKLNVNHVMKRARPDNYLALCFQDYKNRSPSEAELLEGVNTRLKTYLPGSLETELKPAADNQTLGSQPARVLEFTGIDENSVFMTGECYLLSYRGYAYWFFTWGPDKDRDAIKPEWEHLRQGFTLLENRSGWTETPRETEIAGSAAGAKIGCRLKPVKGLWKAVSLDNAEARAQYEKAALVLTGTKPGSTVKAATAATAQVVILDETIPKDLAGAVVAAHDFLLERQKDKRDGGDYTYPDTKIEAVQDKTLKNIDDPIGKGPTAGQVQKLIVANDKDRHRYVVLRVMNHPQGVVVLWLECDNRYRDYWDPEFMALLESFEFK
jgi:hypothetical protein